jgi:hypothetical protein
MRSACTVLFTCTQKTRVYNTTQVPRTYRLEVGENIVFYYAVLLIYFLEVFVLFCICLCFCAI